MIFDWKFYLEIYPDLGKAGINDEKSATIHYNRYGKREKRYINSKQLLVPKDFDWKIYLLLNSDLKEIKTENQAKLHYISFGKIEERKYKNNKKLFSGYKFINYNFSLNKFKNYYGKEKEIMIKKYNDKKLYYLDQYWQYPVITEKSIFDYYFNSDTIPENYLAFPWATLLDEINMKRKTTLLKVIYDFKVDKGCFTVCQHIHFRSLLPLLKKIGITHLFASHCSKTDVILEENYDIKIIPFPLFPYNDNKQLINNYEKGKYLCSFVGSYEDYYLTDVRKKLKILENFEDCYIKLKSGWHFHEIVYEKQINKKEIKEFNKKEEENNFSDLLLKSIFSLCPSGSGPNSIRLWESLSYGSIPVILADDLKLPEFVDWDDICVRYNENNLDGLYEYLKSIPEQDIKYKREKCLEVYSKYFSKDKMYMTIEEYYKYEYENVILIPYRNRKKDLDYFIKNSLKLIKENVRNCLVVLLEQEEGELFNRGKLLNYGFKEFLNKTKYFITQDIDVNPKKDVLKLYDSDLEYNEIRGIYSSPWITLGGVIKIRSCDIKKINGFPNNYWGWGNEDRALYNRAKFYNYDVKFNIFSDSKDVNKYFDVFNNYDRKKSTNFNKNRIFEYETFLNLDYKLKVLHLKKSGLNKIYKPFKEGFFKKYYLL